MVPCPSALDGWFDTTARHNSPYSDPCPCTSRPGWPGSWTPQRQRCGACAAVRGDGIACQGMQASIGSPTTCQNTAFLPTWPCHVEVTYSSATSHGSQQAAVDLNDLLDRLTCYPVSSSGTRVGGYNDAALESKGLGCGTVGDLDGAVWVGVVVGHCAEP